MGALVIVLTPERTKGALLPGEIEGWWACGFRLECAMHALVRAMP